MEDNQDLVKTYDDINAYGFTDRLKNRVFEKLKEILNRFDKSSLLDVVYTVVKELIVNATKALMKRIVFAENNLDIDDHEEWQKGTAVFKDKLRERFIKEYVKKSKSLNFKVKIRYIYNKKGMRVEVVNNTPIPKIDEKRLRKELSIAMKYKSIADYYIDNADNLEGAGMGLALIIILLMNQGLDPQYLRIGNVGEETIARVEIPFTGDYIPYRDQKFKEKFEKEKTSVPVAYDFD
ncbi:MAG: histidine kinase [bacterium]|nr:histidine kinase [bacterium]